MFNLNVDKPSDVEYTAKRCETMKPQTSATGCLPSLWFWPRSRSHGMLAPSPAVAHASDEGISVLEGSNRFYDHGKKWCSYLFYCKLIIL